MKPFTALFGCEAIAFGMLGLVAGPSLCPFTVSVSLVTAFASVKEKQAPQYHKNLFFLFLFQIPRI
jgi:hypothetical protein